MSREHRGELRTPRRSTPVVWPLFAAVTIISVAPVMQSGKRFYF